jgi:small subunit ribosomal protein S17
MAKSIVGIVSSDKTDKTIVVTVHTRKTHRLYRKQYMVTSKFMAHDEKNAAKVGDTVVIVETRPISRRKRFALSEILEKPKLREENLQAVKSDDTGQKDSKSKQEDDEQKSEQTDIIVEKVAK